MMKYSVRSLSPVVLAALAILGPGCVGEDAAGAGSLALDVSGGAALRDGFPHTEGDVTHAFADGWTLQFDKYVIAVGDVELVEQDGGEVVNGWAGPRMMDLAASATGSETLVTLDDVPARRFDFGFSFLSPKELPGESSVSNDDIQAMIDNGWALLVAGQAQHAATSRTVRFDLGLPVATRYYECLNGKDGTQGVAIEANKTTGAYIYAHAIHLFWDTLASGDEELRFEAFAAVAGDDDVVTEEEITTQDLTDLRDANGEPLKDDQGHSVVYNDGGLLPPAQWTLFHFVNYAARASAHFNGIGLCSVESLE
jgi:hypothetical protein